MPALTASQLSLFYGEVEIFADVGFQLDDGARIGIVGPNGGGKTSLIRILAGELEPNAGSAVWRRGLRLGYVPQTPAQTAHGTLRDEVMLAFTRLRQIEDELAASALDIQVTDADARRRSERRYDALLREYEALGGYDYMHRLERVLDGVALSPQTLDTPASAASGGERTRAALARALLSDPDFLILDEPTNYLDFRGLDWLETFLSRFAGGFIVVSHDRYFLDKVAERILEMDNGRLQAFPGNYSKYRALKDEALRRQQIEYERQQEYIEREEAFIRRYRAGQRAREARGRATRLERLQRIPKPQSNASIHLQSVSANRTGHIALRTSKLSVGYRENGYDMPLLRVADAELERGSRTAVVGSNGVGKSTLIETLLGLAPPISGSARLGHNVEPGYYSQGSGDLPERSSVIDALLDARNLRLPDARNYLARFLFRGDDVFKPVAALSGGERSRLALARLLIAAPNMLVLDEPTTHLDIPSREALEQALQSYNGTLLFVSHDRRLIASLATQLWVAEDGAVSMFKGGFEDWINGRQPQNADVPAQSQASKPRNPAARRRAAAAARQKAKRDAPPDYEGIITGLETQLAQIDAALRTATERQSVADIARLGEEYAATQALLERTWSEWSERS